MVLHLLYIIAFTVLAVLAIANLIRNLISLGIDSQRPYSNRNSAIPQFSSQKTPPHPEFLDESGRLINEPLLVMRSMTVEDAREQLDALYESSPGPSNLNSESREEQ
ncbi:Protein of unknown function (DUF2973) [Leptolyngbyaceae cyanobacterium JSC-12]|nr:Protein of unknown function (DUF2973) [Leptolyngbyaceae cyanobacterium JSC-12]